MVQLHTSYLKLPDIFYTQVNPISVQTPRLILFNESLATHLGSDFMALSANERIGFFSGNNLPVGATPLAQAYAGHQFGYFTMLGDGRAHLLGEYQASDGRCVDIQLKGSGRTPYARRGDGRAALGPMLREYIISEAMHALGIPTTRSLAVVATGEMVYRDTPLPGAILTRIAASHLRVGTFEFAAAQRDSGCVKSLLDYTLARLYPALQQAENPALALLQHVIERQADLMVHWMRVGFIHGVMNTDNMTLSGETIDYGPCAFMDAYHPKTVFSSIDEGGRYAYINQPRIAQWNIAKLAEVLLPLLDTDMPTAIAIAEKEVYEFLEVYTTKWLAMMRHKLGLDNEHQDDIKLIDDLLAWMQQHGADYTNTFRDLTYEILPLKQSYTDPAFKAWYQRWHTRRLQSTLSLEASVALMKKVSPAVIPRNHKVEATLVAATEGNIEPLHALLNVLRAPYLDHINQQAYQLPPQPSERVYQTFCGT